MNQFITWYVEPQEGSSTFWQIPESQRFASANDMKM